jgi:hypothetical protein
MMKPHRAEAERFLKALDPRVKHHTFQTFDDNAQRKDPQLTRMIHGTLSHQFDTLSRLNAAGAGIFVTVNMTDLRGRKADNIVQARCLFVDLDGAPLPKSGPKPHIVTETSAEHFHVYWRVKEADVPVHLLNRIGFWRLRTLPTISVH